ncbi:MAG: hypothetical protein ABJC74_16555 [Gemmatimonadota bacterium]
MATNRKTVKPVKKAQKSKDLSGRKLSDKAAAQVKGGRRDRLAANHNQTVQRH